MRTLGPTSLLLLWGCAASAPDGAVSRSVPDGAVSRSGPDDAVSEFGPAPSWEAALDQAARAPVDAGRAQSISAAVVKNGRVWARAYGESSKGLPASVEGTFYEAGSVTKVFTALLLADAIERGEVDADARIRDLAPDLEVSDEVGAIRLVALANHSSGLPRMPANFAPKDGTQPYVDYELSRLWAALAETELGPQRYTYSNFGMAVLGQLLARHAGQSYEALLGMRVLEPLELSSLRLSPAEGDAQPYDEAGVPQPSWTFDAFAPAGALRASAPALLRFVQAQLTSEDGQGALASAMARTQAQTTPLPGPGGIGLGWHIDGQGRRWHNGQTMGSHAFIGLKPGAFGVVVLSNTATPDLDRVGQAMLDILEGKPVELTFKPVVEVSEALLRRYVGEYLIEPTFSLSISLRDSRIYVQGTGQPAFPLTPVGDHTFELSAVQASGRFILSDEGPASALIWNQGGQSVRAQRRE